MKFIKKHWFFLGILLFFAYSILVQLKEVKDFSIFLELDKIGVILLSAVLFPLISKQEELKREVNQFIDLIKRYINYNYVNKVFYFEYLDLVETSFNEQIKFFKKMEINPEKNPLLLSGCCERETANLKNWQEKIRELSKDIVIFRFYRHAIMVMVVLCLVFG